MNGDAMMDAWYLTLDHFPEPSPQEEEEQAELAQPMELGRSAMQAIADKLGVAGVAVTHPVSEWEAYGWEFTIREGDAPITCMLQWAGEWLLMCWAHRTFWDRLRGRRFEEEFARARPRIASAISAAFDVPQPAWRPRA
jgi:hypothetical protein